jgi:hypothetical protein
MDVVTGDRSQPTREIHRMSGTITLLAVLLAVAIVAPLLWAATLDGRDDAIQHLS